MVHNASGYFLVRGRDAGEGGGGIWRDGSCFRNLPSWETAFLGGGISGMVKGHIIKFNRSVVHSAGTLNLQVQGSVIKGNERVGF